VQSVGVATPRRPKALAAPRRPEALPFILAGHRSNPIALEPTYTSANQPTGAFLVRGGNDPNARSISMTTLLHRRGIALSALIAVALAGVTAIAYGSDHQDTPEVELSPRMDINDVYAFPGSAADRIALVMTTSSPITPGQSASAAFDPNLLYQLKVDNTGDGVDQSQRVRLRGPVKPVQTGTRSTLSNTTPAVMGATNQVLSGGGGIQLFAGLRDDPFFIDLEQFFRIIPDRRPATGPLAQAQAPASAFRNPGIDYLRDINTLAFVIELPTALLTAGGTQKLGIWGTISR
jgi:hypothetical protein